MNTLFRGVLVATGCVFLASVSVADTTHVRGYVKSDGTYVPPHVKTTPNSSKLDNWSSKGNVNPYTGKEGTKNPYGARRPK